MLYISGSNLKNIGHAAALVQTARQVPKLFKQEDLLPAALVMKPLFALMWAWLVCIWFSIFPGSLPSQFLIKLLNSVARSGPSFLWRNELAGAIHFDVV